MLVNRKKINATIIAAAFVSIVVAKAIGIVHISFSHIATYLLAAGAVYLILESIYSKFEAQLIMMDDGCLQRYLFDNFRRTLIISFAIALAGIRESLAYVLAFFAVAIAISILGRLVLFFIREAKRI